MTRTGPQQGRRIRRKLRRARLRYAVALAAGPVAAVLAASAASSVFLAGVGPRAHLSTWQPPLVAVTVLALCGAVAIRFRGGFPSLYRTAQILDGRAGLCDAISTAWFLLQTPAYADNAIAAAHIADADHQIAQAELGKLFSLPRKSLATALAGLLLLSAVSSPRTPSAGRANNPAGRAHSGAGGPAVQPQSSEGSAEFASGPRQAQPAVPEGAVALEHAGAETATGIQPAQSPLRNVRTQPSMDFNSDPAQSVLDRRSPASDQGERAAAEGAHGMPVASKGEADRGDRPEETPQARSPIAHSVMSQLLSPLKRLFGANQNQENQTKANSAAERASSPADGAQAPHKDDQSTPVVARDQQPAPPTGSQYGSADASHKQAFSKQPAGVPASIGATAAQPGAGLTSTLSAQNKVESIGANPGGEAGHTRVRAVRGAASLLPGHSFNFRRSGDSNRPMARDDIPLAYRSSIRAYMAAPREQPGTPDTQGK